MESEMKRILDNPQYALSNAHLAQPFIASKHSGNNQFNNGNSGFGAQSPAFSGQTLNAFGNTTNSFAQPNFGSNTSANQSTPFGSYQTSSTFGQVAPNLAHSSFTNSSSVFGSTLAQNAFGANSFGSAINNFSTELNPNTFGSETDAFGNNTNLLSQTHIQPNVYSQISPGNKGIVHCEVDTRFIQKGVSYTFGNIPQYI